MKIADKTGVSEKESLLIYELEGRALSALIMLEMGSWKGRGMGLSGTHVAAESHTGRQIQRERERWRERATETAR